jgi:hypothetical protein
MLLTTGLQSISEVNEQLLRILFEDEDFPEDFVILSQAPEIYMQAAGEWEGAYSLEYRDGDGDHHFSAGDRLRKRDLERAFLWYLAGDPRWRTEFAWKKIAM